MYTGIYDSFWTDEKNENLSDGGKLLFLYLMTCPHRNLIGFYRLPQKYIMADLGWTQETVSKRLGELLRNGQVRYDERFSVVLIVNFLKHNPLENPNQKKSACKKLEEVMHSSLFGYFMRILEGLGKGYETVMQSVTQTLSKQEPEKEPEKEPEERGGFADASPPAPSKKKFIPPTEEEVSAYCKERANAVNAGNFVAFYESKGWMVGKNKMKDWKAAVRTWEQRDGPRAAPTVTETEKGVFQL